jgi:hypothetical protein
VADYARTRHRDPRPHLQHAISCIQEARKIRENDPRGVTLASLAHLVAARWRLEQGLDPDLSVRKGLEMVDLALEWNEALAPAWVRKGELLLIRAAWRVTQGKNPAPDLDLAEQAISQALAINATDAMALAAGAEVFRRQAEWQEALGEKPMESVDKGLEMAMRALAIYPGHAQALTQQEALEELSARSSRR